MQECMKYTNVQRSTPVGLNGPSGIMTYWLLKNVDCLQSNVYM